MICKHCHAQIPEDSVFCSACGQKQEAEILTGNFCVNCGTGLNSDMLFCPVCGTKAEGSVAEQEVVPEAIPEIVPEPIPEIVQEAAPEAAPQCEPESDPVVPAPVSQKNRKKSPLSMKILIAVLGLIAAAAVVLILFSAGSRPNIVYVKDGQLQHIATGAKEAFILTEELTREDLEDDDLVEAAEWLGSVRMSADGKKLFYPDKYEDNSYALYYRNIANTKKDPVKLDSGLTSSYYSINTAGTLVTYLKDGKLYQHNLKEKNKIDSDVGTFSVSENGSALLYTVDEDSGSSYAATEAPAAAPADEVSEEVEEKKRKYNGYELYVKYGKEDPVQLEENVYDWDANEDLSVVYFLVNYDLYMAKKGSDPEMIASDVLAIHRVNNTGCYYSVQTEESVDLLSIIEDDLKNDDSAYILEYLEGSTIDNPLMELHFHNGSESTVIEEQMLKFITGHTKKEFAAYTALEGDGLPVMKMSEFLEDNAGDLYDERINSRTVTYIAQGTATAQLELDDIYRITMNEKADTLWVSTEYDNSTKETLLYEVKLSADDIKSIDEIDEEVYYGTVWTDGVNYAYWRNVKDYEGELCYNGKEIADDAATYCLTMNKDSGNAFLLMDYSSKRQDYTLACWDGKKLITVDEEVYDYQVLNGKTVAYLKDYSIDKCEGDLYVWDGKEPEKTDEDVAYIMPVYQQK